MAVLVNAFFDDKFGCFLIFYEDLDLVYNVILLSVFAVFKVFTVDFVFS
jgi:hypothetical protein